MLGVSERTIRRRRVGFGMTVGQKQPYSDIPDDDLDVFIKKILDLSPQSGERMVIGSLRSQGIKVQRERIRKYIGRVDPISRELRKRTTINRELPTVYNHPTLYGNALVTGNPHPPFPPHPGVTNMGQRWEIMGDFLAKLSPGGGGLVQISMCAFGKIWDGRGYGSKCRSTLRHVFLLFQ